MNNKVKQRFRDIPAVQMLTKYFLLITLVILLALFNAIVPNFLSRSNIITILKATSFVALLGFAAMIVMRTGEMTFAVGAQATVAAALTGKLLSMAPTLNYWVAAAAGILFSTLLIMICAFFIIEFKVPSFIATMSMSMIMDAIVILLTGNSQMFDKNWPAKFTVFKTFEIAGVPLMIVAAFIFLIFFWVVNARTRLGRYFFCVGANATAALQSGVNVRGVRYLAFLISGVSAGFAGVIQSSNLGQIQHSLGSDYLMSAICAATLSATFLKPGDYNVPGVIVSSLILMIIRNAVSNMGAKSYINDIITAVILLIGVGAIAIVRKEGLVKVSFN